MKYYTVILLLILYGKYWFGTTMTSLNVYLLSSRKVCWWITAIRRWSLLSKQHRQVREACCQSHQELLLVQGKTYLPFHSARENHFRNSPLSRPCGGTLWDTSFLGNLLCSMLLKCYLRILEKTIGESLSEHICRFCLLVISAERVQ